MLILIMSFNCGKCYAQNGASIAFNYKGAWSDWNSSSWTIWNLKNRYGIVEYNNVSAYTDGSGLCLYTDGKIKFFSFQIDNFTPPTKKEIKEHQKSDEWFVYTGTVTYYVNDVFPTAQDLAKNEVLIQPNPRRDETPVVERTAQAIIKMAPFKKAPYCYNLYFDDIAIAIDIRGLKFGDKNSGPYGGQKRE